MPAFVGLGKADQAKYGGPEWVQIDWSRLDELTFEELDALERPIKKLWGCSIPTLVYAEFYEDTARGKRGGIWLLRKLQDIETPDLEDFHIKTQQLRAKAVKPQKGDDVPPGQSSSTSSAEEPSATA